MLIPIRFIRKTERRIKTRPMIAEVIISLPLLSLSGLPAEVVTMKTPKRIRARASPPPMPVASLRMELIRPVPELTLIQPRAVMTPSSPSGVAQVTGVLLNFSGGRQISLY